MLDLAREIIGSQPILTAFLAIGLGYLVGQISIGGFSLGVGAVLFVGLAIGAFAPKAQITGPIGPVICAFGAKAPIASPTKRTAPTPSENPPMLIWPTR